MPLPRFACLSGARALVAAGMYLSLSLSLAENDHETSAPVSPLPASAFIHDTHTHTHTLLTPSPPPKDRRHDAPATTHQPRRARRAHRRPPAGPARAAVAGTHATDSTGTGAAALRRVEHLPISGDERGRQRNELHRRRGRGDPRAADGVECGDARAGHAVPALDGDAGLCGGVVCAQRARRAGGLWHERGAGGQGWGGVGADGAAGGEWGGCVDRGALRCGGGGERAFQCAVGAGDRGAGGAGEGEDGERVA